MRRYTLIAWAVLAGWLALIGLTSGSANDLTAAQDNSSSAYLPAQAESTVVQNALQARQQEATAAVVVVYERRTGITPADLTRATADAAAVASVAGVTGPVDGPRTSDDRLSLRTVVPVASDGGWDRITAAVDRIRARVGTSAAGLTVALTGPAAVIADTSRAFSGLDSTLLYTTLAIVVVILLLTYRSPVLWLLPLVAVGGALTLAEALVDLLARHAGLTVNAQSASILTVLVFGAGTDYALLLTARYREELRRHADRRAAMVAALRRATPTIVASAATVTTAMFCLMVATTASTKGMGPVAAIGVLCALLAVLTLLPALLLVFGRWVFWPAVPRYGSADPAERGLWARLGVRISGRPRLVWAGAAAGLAVLAAGLLGLHANGIDAKDAFVTPPESITAARVLAAHFPAGDAEPVTVLVRPDAAAAVHDAIAVLPGVARVSDPARLDDAYYAIDATLNQAADSPAAQTDVRHLREVAQRIDREALVGGSTATLVDTNDAADHDRNRIVPLVLVVVLAILALLLRALVASLLLVGTVVLSFAAALGASALLFGALHWPGSDSSLPLFVFVFLVALGVDYNIFLATRIREETQALGDTRAAVRSALAATGGVITSAGLVLAGTFAALASLPLIAYAQIGIAIAIGVLLDTTVVRGVLVTALFLDLGSRSWWPARRRQPGPLSSPVPAQASSQ